MSFAEFRRTTLEILRGNIGVPLAVEFFVFTVGLKIGNGTLVESKNWRVVLALAVLVPALYIVTLLIIQRLQDAADDKRERAGNLVFAGAISYRTLFLAVVILFAVLSFGSYYQGDRGVATGIVGTVSFSLIALYAWPRPIKFVEGAIQQKRMLGGFKTVPFSEVLSVTFNAGQQCIITSGKNGVRIVHSMFHAGRKQFARQLYLLTGTAVFGLTA